MSKEVVTKSMKVDLNQFEPSAIFQFTAARQQHNSKSTDQSKKEEQWC